MGLLDSILKIVKEKVTEAVNDTVNTQNTSSSEQIKTETAKSFEQKFNPSTDENYFAGRQRICQQICQCCNAGGLGGNAQTG